MARFLGIETNPEDRVCRFEQLDQAVFQIMNFCKVEAGRLCWIYLADRLLLLANVNRTTLLHWVPGDDEVV